MGIITIFVRQDCLYCDKVISSVKELITLVNNHVISEGGTPDLTVQCVEAVGPMASLCIRLTGSLSVPHVFFNEEYIGNCSTFCGMFEQDKRMSPLKKPKQADISSMPPCDLGESVAFPASAASATRSSSASSQSSCCCDGSRESIFKMQEECCGGRLFEKLISLALSPSPVFPPPYDAKIIKLTDKAASSSQPTQQQMHDLAKMGFKSIINLTPSQSRAFDCNEEAILKQHNIAYFQAACDPNTLTSHDIHNALMAIKAAPSPTLVHDASGNLSMFLVLYDAIKALPSGSSNEEVVNTVFQVGRQLNCDLSQYKNLVLANGI